MASFLLPQEEAAADSGGSIGLGILSEATKEAGIELVAENDDDNHSNHNDNVNKNMSTAAVTDGVAIVHEVHSIDGACGNGYELPISLDEPDADCLTDSNSSGKMSPRDEDNLTTITNLIDVDGSQLETVPINFPIRGRILARLRLQGKGCEYFMTKSKLVIGRNSSKGAVDIDIGNSSFISRNHLTITHEVDEFYLSCGGKNGVFVDDTFQKIGAPRMRLPHSCALRFPSTQIIISFDAAKVFINQYSTPTPKPTESYEYIPGETKSMRALSVHIPENGTKEEKLKRPFNKFFSPCPSPSGTMSAVNSCPTSPTNALVYSKKAIVGTEPAEPHRYVSNTAAIKDNRIPLFDEHQAKPPYSYAQLIVQAISSTADKQMTLSGIYAYISRNYQHYRANDKGWQNSIRHNLSLNRYFIKVARTLDEPGKGCFWSIDPVSEPKLVAQAFRRRNKRGIPYFRGTPSNLSNLTTQSCPASPLSVTFYPEANVVTSTSATAPTSNIVTIATVNSVAEAITMQSKFPHIIDINRAIQSAPGSPQGYKVLSPAAASMIAAKVLPKGTASIIGSKSSGITLIQPMSSLVSTSSAISGKPHTSIVTLSPQQAQLINSGTFLSNISTIPVTSHAVNTITANTAATSTSLDTVDARPPNSQARVAGSKRPIFIQFTSVPPIDDGTVTQSSAKIPKTEGS